MSEAIAPDEQPEASGIEADHSTELLPGAPDRPGADLAVDAAVPESTEEAPALDEPGLEPAEDGAMAERVEVGAVPALGADGDGYGIEEDGFEVPPALSRMLFVDVVLVLPATHPVVVLQEAEVPYRELRIPIGGPEGIAIGYAARRIATPRPLTHALLTTLLESFDLSLDVVRITSVRGGNFTAEIHVSGPTGTRTIDCRPSDAIALALLQQMVVPIMVAPDVLDTAGTGAAGSN